MSKELEKEYRALVKSEVPDLWARIEAGLDEKMNSEIKNFEKKNFEKMNSDIKNFNNKHEMNSIIKKIFPVKIWATVAAACICVGLIIPIMKGRMVGTKGMSNDTAAQSDFTANNAGTSYETADGAKAADGAMLSGSLDNSIDNNADDSVLDFTNNAVVTEGAAYDRGDALEEEVAAEETYTFLTEVEIIDADVRMDSKIVYTARILSCENLDLQKDSEIRIAVSALADNDMFLEKGKTYELTLCEDNSGEELTYSIAD